MASPSRKSKSLLSGVRDDVKAARRRIAAARSRARAVQKQARQLKAGFDAQTGQQWCNSCKTWVSNRDWATHVAEHQMQSGAGPSRTPKPVEKSLATPASRDKSRERERRSAETSTPADRAKTARAHAQRTKRTDKDIADRDEQVAQAWERRKKEAVMAGTNPNRGMVPVCANVVAAANKWAEHQPTTRIEYEIYLESSTRMFAGIAAATRSVAQNIIASKLHPAIARPIDGAADMLDEERLAFTRAYMILCRIYKSRIEAEDQDGPKPTDEFWKDGSGG